MDAPSFLLRLILVDSTEPDDSGCIWPFEALLLAEQRTTRACVRQDPQRACRKQPDAEQRIGLHEPRSCSDVPDDVRQGLEQSIIVGARSNGDTYRTIIQSRHLRAISNQEPLPPKRRYHARRLQSRRQFQEQEVGRGGKTRTAGQSLQSFREPRPLLLHEPETPPVVPPVM